MCKNTDSHLKPRTVTIKNVLGSFLRYCEKSSIVVMVMGVF